MNLTLTKNSPAPPHRRTAIFQHGPVCHRRPNFVFPMTPSLRWKLEDRHGSRGRSRFRFQARKIAAGLWQLNYREISGADRRRTQGEIRHCRRDQSRGGGVEAEQGLQRRGCLDSSNNEIKIKVSLAEAAELGEFFNQRSGREQPFTAASATTSDLKEELAVAQTRIRKLKSKQRNSKKIIEQLKGKLEENRAMWRNERNVKLDNLDDEIKTHQRIETINENLTKELAEIKARANKYKQEHEKEKKNRELLEEVCAEMAKQIVGEKKKMEALKRESMNLCEEIEEERNMLQMAEVWREERVQMKLIDAKLAVEEKYIQMNKLIIDLETFMISKGEKVDEMELKKAETIHENAKSLDIEEIEGLFYEPQTEDLKEVNSNSVEKECVSENPFDDSSNKTTSSEVGELKESDSVSQRNLQNPHIKRGTYGCIEWPRGVQKNCLKVKTLDAMIQTQKSQLRHVLNHKMN